VIPLMAVSSALKMFKSETIRKKTFLLMKFEALPNLVSTPRDVENVRMCCKRSHWDSHLLWKNLFHDVNSNFAIGMFCSKQKCNAYHSQVNKKSLWVFIRSFVTWHLLWKCMLFVIM
jgi:hypothetical protein